MELKLGESYAIEGTEMTLQIEEAYETEELSPADPSGYFYYYEDKEGYHYYVVSAKLINPARIAVKPADFEAVASKGRKKYETKVVLEASSGAMFLREDEETVGGGADASPPGPCGGWEGCSGYDGAVLQ